MVTLCLRSTLPLAGNVDDDKEIDEIYTLLTENYVEDDDAWLKALPCELRRLKVEIHPTEKRGLLLPLPWLIHE